MRSNLSEQRPIINSDIFKSTQCIIINKTYYKDV